MLPGLILGSFLFFFSFILHRPGFLKYGQTTPIGKECK
nr:MAG TPA: hypothetical protein [Caudoviricetes sp.]